MKQRIKECYDEAGRRGGWVDWGEYSKRSLEGLLSCLEAYGLDKRGAIRVLDIGAGAGRYSAFLKARYQWDVIGCDFSKELCLSGSKAHPEISFVCSDAENLPFTDNCADLVISVGLIECLQNPAKTFIEIHRVLKTNGVGVIRVTNKLCVGGFLEALLNKTGRTLWGVYPGFYLYSLFSIKKAASNFDIVKFYGCRLVDRWWFSPLQLLEPALMLLERKMRRVPFIYDSYFVIVKKEG